jgi:cytochrome P450
MFVSNLFASPYIILETPELAKEYLLNHQHFFKQNLAFFSELYFKKSIAISSGEDWNRQKRIMSKAMNYDFFKTIVPTIQATSRKVFESVESNQPMNVYKPTFSITAEVVSHAFFSKNMNDLKVRGMGVIEKLR